MPHFIGMKKVRYLKLFFLYITLLWLLAANGQDYEKIDSLQRFLTKTKKSEKSVNVLIAISHEFEICNTDSALHYANQALSLSEQNNLKKEKVNALLQRGRMLMQLVDYRNAMETFEVAIKLAEKFNMPNELAISNGVIGTIYAEFGDYDNSAKYYFRALELFEKVGNKMEIGVTLGNIAADLMSQRNYRKALDYMNKALVITREINDKPGIAQQYNNIAGVYYASFKDYNKAMGYYRKAYQVNIELGDKLQLGMNLLNMGYCFFRTNQNDSALPYFKNSRALFMEIDNPIKIAYVDMALAKYFYEKSQPDLSLQHSKEALKIGTAYNSKELISEAAELLQMIYMAKRDTINAFKYSIINFQAKDSLQLMQSQKTLFRLEYQYNYEKQDKERKLKQQRSYYILGFIILGLLSGIVIIFLFYSRQKIKIKNAILEKQKMASDLNFKNKELTINLMALMKKNETHAEISKKLLLIEKKVPRDKLHDAICELNKELKQTSDEKIWKEFALRFNEINSDFYEKLLLKYPDLSQNELKLCAYLRLNMTSKEISELTGQRTLTLESARYRLRKKLGLSGSDSNLVNFLSQI
jgi:tetratricopeptide (TPR) repeat protein